MFKSKYQIHASTESTELKKNHEGIMWIAIVLGFTLI